MKLRDKLLAARKAGLPPREVPPFILLDVAPHDVSETGAQARSVKSVVQEHEALQEATARGGHHPRLRSEF